ncbi:MAG: exosortase H [Planctomycetes bacterium HGW-Planctomycetes-1]|nr:MAG: exosortase H [Planctomycetes bacterium HGW-Planctomycetes-1]
MKTATERIYETMTKNSKRHLRKKPAGDRFFKGWRRRHPIFLFLAVFAVLMGLFYGFAVFTPFYKRDFLLSYLPFNARVSGAILGFFGQDITVAGRTISSPDFSVEVYSGCDGIEPIALFVCAVLAFPAPFLRKLPGIIAGTLLLAILNFVRVVSLFGVGVYFPKAFLFMHLDVWQALFIFFAVLFWIVWLRWAAQNQISTQHVSS